MLSIAFSDQGLVPLRRNLASGWMIRRLGVQVRVNQTCVSILDPWSHGHLHVVFAHDAAVGLKKAVRRNKNRNLLQSPFKSARAHLKHHDNSMPALAMTIELNHRRLRQLGVDRRDAICIHKTWHCGPPVIPVVAQRATFLRDQQEIAGTWIHQPVG